MWQLKQSDIDRAILTRQPRGFWSSQEDTSIQPNEDTD